MTRIVGPTGSRRRRRFVFVPIFILAAAALVFAIAASAGPIGTAAGFEDDDGNLAVNTAGQTDWNSFSPATWTGTAPYRQAAKTVNGWQFNGLEDALKTNTDTGYKGGTKQDDNCATIIGTSAPNKDDLKRVYIAHKTVPVTRNGVTTDHVFLELAWVRIPLNTTSSSAHVGFEFNQNQATNPGEPNYAPCPGPYYTPPGGSPVTLVQRHVGDLLIVYDFEGGSSAIPTLTLRRWITAGTCEVGNDSPPCWGVAANLTTSGFAEAKVNSNSPALDTVAPTSETLGNAEFGEAGVDLTDAGIFQAGQCLSFGTTEAVSRSSGNSNNAAMEDLVGPGRIRIANCGQVKIIKQTDPRGLNATFTYTSNVTSSNPACTQGNGNFSLNDNGNTGKTLGSTAAADNSAGNTQNCTQVPSGNYTVTEDSTLPAGFTFDSLSCSASGTGTSVSKSGATATITLAGDGSVTCLYINKARAAIQILKESAKTGHPLVQHDGAVFSYDGTSVTDNGATDEDSTVGKVCVSDLAPGNYSVTETSAPSGYAGDSSTQTAVAVAGTNCTDNKPTTANSAVFIDPPLSDIQVNFKDGGSGETSATISCDNATGTSDDTTVTGWDKSHTVTGIHAPTTVKCTIVIDP